MSRLPPELMHVATTPALETDGGPSPDSGAASPAIVAPPAPVRLASMDAYRGFVMLLMMGEVLKFGKVSAALPESGFWKVLGFHQSHVEWIGCTLHDMIQPSFTFLVGVALPYSIASRVARGQRFGAMLGHTVWRSLLLIFLGIFLRSQYGTQTQWQYEDTLAQIGLGYTFLFLLGFRPVRDQLIALGLLLIGVWTAFALYPLPSAGFDYPSVGVPAEWLREHGLSGFAAHWQKNSNVAWAFDTWFLNLFPRDKPFLFNRGGYATLSFLPTLATMILGLLAGQIMRSERSAGRKLGWLALGGVGMMAAGWALGALGLCPIVKRIWTPSWVLYSGGGCFLFLAAFYALVDLARAQRVFFALIVVGMNSIAAYLISHLFKSFIGKQWRIHVAPEVFTAFGAAYETLIHGFLTLLVMWLLLYWMYRRKLFLRI